MARSKRPAAKPTDPPAENQLAELLKRIDNWLRKHRKHYYQTLAPGLSDAEAEALEKQLGQPLPDELRTWLGWHNGQGDEIVGSFFESFNLMSAGQVVEAKNYLDGEPSPGWKKSWLPFLADDADDYLCVCPEKAGARVREVWQGQDKHSVVAPSLTAWAQELVTALEAGQFVEDEERGGFHRHEGAS